MDIDNLPRWFAFVDRAIDYCIAIGVNTFIVSIVIHALIYFEISITADLVSIAMVISVIFTLGSIATGMLLILLDPIFSYIYRRFIKKHV